MKPFECFELNNAELTTRLGCTIDDAVAEAIDFAQLSHGSLVSFTFNDVKITVSHESQASLIVRDYLAHF